MRTLLLDCPFSLPDADKYSFRSLVSVFDYDLVMWDPGRSGAGYTRQYQPEYRGRPSLGEAESVAFVEDVARRRREFKEFLALGRALVVFAEAPQIFWVDTGERKTSGTGRNQVVTRIVKDIDLLSAFPFPYRAQPGQGIELELCSDIASFLWRQTKGDWVYRCTLDEFPGEPIMKVADVGKVVASVQISDDGGVVALLPAPWIPDDEYDEDDEYDDEEEDDEQAEVGSDAEPGDDHADAVDRFAVAKAIREWVGQLGLGDDEPLPEWCSDLLFESEVARTAEIAKVEASLAKLAEEMEALKAAQAEDEQWKRLIVSQGEPLERQVSAALAFLGFETLESRRGRSDIRLNRADTRVVVEVKGVARTAAEKNAAQLEKWVAEELAEDVKAKGILVVNGWREVPLRDRQKVFPDQMLQYAIARGHCLVTGFQLLSMCARVRADESQRDLVAGVLLDTVGIVEGYDDPDQVFAAVHKISSGAVDLN